MEPKPPKEEPVPNPDIASRVVKTSSESEIGLLSHERAGPKNANAAWEAERVEKAGGWRRQLAARLGWQVRSRRAEAKRACETDKEADRTGFVHRYEQLICFPVLQKKKQRE